MQTKLNTYLLFFVLILSISFSSCGAFKLSDNEKAAIDSVGATFGGKVSWVKGKYFEDGEGFSRIEIKIEDADAFELAKNGPALPAMGVAYCFYSNMKEDKEKYKIIRVSPSISGGKAEFDFTMDQMKEADGYVNVIRQTIDNMNTKNVDGLYNQFEHDDTGFVNVTHNNIEEILNVSDTLLGTIYKFRFAGFEYTKYPQREEPYAIVYSNLKGSLHNTFLTLIVDPKSRKLMGLNF